MRSHTSPHMRAQARARTPARTHARIHTHARRPHAPENAPITITAKIIKSVHITITVATNTRFIGISTFSFGIFTGNTFITSITFVNTLRNYNTTSILTRRTRNAFCSSYRFIGIKSSVTFSTFTLSIITKFSGTSSGCGR